MRLELGDCLEKLKDLPDNSIDSIVTDPPYGLSFMNKKWDYDVPSVDIWKECLRVLKPGGHLLSFSGSRTYHRMAVRIEDAGFEIRDQIMWIYGSGFPKSHNIGKAVDKLQGNDREDLGPNPNGRPNFEGEQPTTMGGKHQWNNITKGTSEWEGWGTALKPAHEPIVMARKPFKGNVAQNVLEWGTGGINIDDSRVGTEQIKSYQTEKNVFNPDYKIKATKDFTISEGRWPANIILDEEAGEVLDQQSGISGTGKKKIGKERQNFFHNENTIFEVKNNSFTNQRIEDYGDKGGASRFFYCPKASKKDRDEGLDLFEEKRKKVAVIQTKGVANDGEWEDGKQLSSPMKNHHPTVKPTELMLYLIKLVTPIGGTVLDCFLGSGSTGKAAVRGGFDFIGIEREEEYYNISKARIENESRISKCS
jgi:site-specific DNA-methyltransferase (adenine-specific)